MGELQSEDTNIINTKVMANCFVYWPSIGIDPERGSLVCTVSQESAAGFQECFLQTGAG